MLTEQTRKQLIEELFQYLRDNMFGDGLNEEYILHGITFSGLENFKDQELIDDYSEYSTHDDNLLRRARIEMEIYNVIK